MLSTQCGGVTFYEGVPSNFSKGAKISTEIDGFFKSSQTASLYDVKESMARYCQHLGGTTIVGFSYGQRSLGFWASIFLAITLFGSARDLLELRSHLSSEINL